MKSIRVALYSLDILQSARVGFQGGGVLHHLVHGDDQEDEVELSKQSNGGVNTRRRTSRGGGEKTANLPPSIKGGLTSLHAHRLIQSTSSAPAARPGPTGAKFSVILYQ